MVKYKVYRIGMIIMKILCPKKLDIMEPTWGFKRGKKSGIYYFIHGNLWLRGYVYCYGFGKC